jgi:DNA-binding IclR family transcriptional regulator
MSTEARNATLRALDLLEFLCGFAVRGASNAELAAAAGLAPHQVTRAAAPLIEKGWVKKDKVTGRFHPTHAFSRLSFRVLAELDAAQQRLDDQRRSLTGA